MSSVHQQTTLVLSQLERRGCPRLFYLTPDNPKWRFKPSHFMTTRFRLRFLCAYDMSEPPCGKYVAPNLTPSTVPPVVLFYASPDISALLRFHCALHRSRLAFSALPLVIGPFPPFPPQNSNNFPSVHNGPMRPVRTALRLRCCFGLLLGFAEMARATWLRSPQTLPSRSSQRYASASSSSAL